MYSEHAIPQPIPSAGNSVIFDVFRGISRYLSASYVIPASKRSMCSAAQRSNLFLLTEQVLAFQVPGQIVELGCYLGDSTQAIASAWQQLDPSREFHVYDDFKFDPKDTGKVKQRFVEGFARTGIALPVIHEGDLHSLLPFELPDAIAFAHIDLGFEEEPRQVAQLVRRSLEAIYPRMSPGAVCVLMDYHDPLRTQKGWDCSPGVKIACDRFLAGRPEKVQLLMGNEYSHAFFRKSLVP